MLEEIRKHAGELREEWSNVIPDDEGFTVKKWVERGTNLAALALVAVKLSGAKDEQERYLLLLSRHSASYPKPAIALSRNDVIEMASDLKRDWSRATDEDTFGKIVEDLLYFRSLPLVAQFAKKLGDYCREEGNDFDHFLDLLAERASAWLPSGCESPKPSGSPAVPPKPELPGAKPTSSSGVSVPVEPSVINNFRSLVADLLVRCKDADFTTEDEDEALSSLVEWLDDLLATPKAPWEARRQEGRIRQAAGRLIALANDLQLGKAGVPEFADGLEREIQQLTAIRNGEEPNWRRREVDLRTLSVDLLNLADETKMAGYLKTMKELAEG